MLLRRHYQELEKIICDGPEHTHTQRFILHRGCVQHDQYKNHYSRSKIEDGYQRCSFHH